MNASSLGALTCRTRCTIDTALKNTYHSNSSSTCTTGNCSNLQITSNDKLHNIPYCRIKNLTSTSNCSDTADNNCQIASQSSLATTNCTFSTMTTCSCPSCPSHERTIDFCQLNHSSLESTEGEKHSARSPHIVSLGYDDKFSLYIHPKNHTNLTHTDQITLPTGEASEASTVRKDCHLYRHHQSVSSCYRNNHHQKIMPVSISSINFLLKSSRKSLASLLPLQSPTSLVLLVITLLFSVTLSTASPSPSSSSSSSSSTSTSSLLSSSSATHSVSNYFASFTTSNTSINFTHIAIDHSTGRLYVGATNWLYQLSSDLTLETSLKTGPVDDSPSCSPEDCSGIDENLIKPTKNVNKVLVIDHMSHKLISCGSVHQGSCRLHNLTDITLAEPLIGVPVAANDENSTTVAFIGPARYSGSGQQSVLYVAASHSRLGPYRDMVPAISSRSLDPSKLFTILEKSFTDTARVDIQFTMRDYYLVKYIHGFSSNSFVYFATVQKRSHFRTLEELGYVSRLARVCSSDAGYHTYTEVTLSCTGKDGREYNLLQGASVIKPGTLLASDLGLDENAEVFIGSFAQSKDHTSVPTSNSAICVYSMDEIERIFTENVHLCYNGSVLTRNMDYIAGSIQDCPQAGKSGNVMNFCGETLKLNGTIPIIGRPVMTLQGTTLTSVLGVSSGRSTFAFTGTSNGHLKKINLRKSQAQELDDILVDAGHPILSDILADHTERHLYVSSAYKLMKIPIDRCDSYESCRQQKQLQEHVLQQQHLKQQQQQRKSSPSSSSTTIISSQRHSSSPSPVANTVSRFVPTSFASLPVSPTVSTSLTRATTSLNSSPQQPVIYSVNPSESFASGGRRVYIYGSGFSSADNCKMILYNYYSADVINDTVCTIANDSVIQCITPSVRKVFDSISANTWSSTSQSTSSSDLFDVNSNSLTVRVSFILDGTTLLKQDSTNLKRSNMNTFNSNNGGGNEVPSSITSFHQSTRTLSQPQQLTSGQVNNNLQAAAAANGFFYFTYYPDPRVFFVFTSNEEEETSIKTYNQGESIVIDGENLRLGATEADVIVTVGDYLCNLTSMSMKQLLCTPPDSDYIEANSLPPVLVKFGDNISYKIGYLRYPHHDKYINTFASTSSSANLTPHMINNDTLGLTSTWLFVTIAVFLGVIVVLVLVGWTTIKHGLFSRASGSIGGNNRRHIGYTSHNINLRRTFGQGISQSNGYHTTGTNYSTNRHYFGTGMRVPPSSIGVFDQGYYDISASMTKVPPPPLISSTLKPLPLIPSSILFNGQSNHGSNVTGVSLDRMTTNTSTSMSSASNESTSSGGSNFLESSTKLTDLDGQNGNNFIVSPSDSAANAIYAEIPEMVATLDNSRHPSSLVNGNNLLSSCGQSRNMPNLLMPFNDTNGNVNGIGPETPLLTLNHQSPASHMMNNHQQVNHFINGHQHTINQFNSGFHHQHLTTNNGQSISSCMSSNNGNGISSSNARTSYSPFINKHQRIQPMSNAVRTNGTNGGKNRHGNPLNGSPAITSTSSVSQAATTVTHNSSPSPYEDAFLHTTNVRGRMIPRGNSNANGGNINNNNSTANNSSDGSKSSSSLLVLDPTAWNY